MLRVLPAVLAPGNLVVMTVLLLRINIFLNCKLPDQEIAQLNCMTQIHHFAYLPGGRSFLHFNSKCATEKEAT